VVPVTASCSNCHLPRDPALSRPEHGGTYRPLVAEHADGKDYVAETGEPCKCGSRKVVIRLRF
jgi:hypothetical protein